MKDSRSSPNPTPTCLFSSQISQNPPMTMVCHITAAGKEEGVERERARLIDTSSPLGADSFFLNYAVKTRCTLRTVILLLLILLLFIALYHNLQYSVSQPVAGCQHPKIQIYTGNICIYIKQIVMYYIIYKWFSTINMFLIFNKYAY